MRPQQRLQVVALPPRKHGWATLNWWYLPIVTVTALRGIKGRANCQRYQPGRHVHGIHGDAHNISPSRHVEHNTEETHAHTAFTSWPLGRNKRAWAKERASLPIPHSLHLKKHTKLFCAAVCEHSFTVFPPHASC